MDFIRAVGLYTASLNNSQYMMVRRRDALFRLGHNCPPFLCVVPGKSGWPIAVLSDDIIDFCHQADGLIQGHNDSLVVAGVFVGQFSALAVLQPFLADLVFAPDYRFKSHMILINSRG